MNEAVLDSSAVLAMLRVEPGAETVEQIINRSILSTVNAAEVVSKLIDRGMSENAARETVSALPCERVDFNEDQALAAGGMRSRSRAIGLSLGDRACLALAEAKNLPVVTTDKQWKKFQSTIEIRLIR